MERAHLFSPWKCKDLELKNRIVFPPMCMYSVEKHDGIATDWHVLHYATRAQGGVGLIIIEMTDVDPDGRITDRDFGLWDDRQIDGIKRIVDVCHQLGAKVGIQIGHAGRKATDAACPVAPSAIRFGEGYQVPKALTYDEIQKIVVQFQQAVKRAIQAGVDLVEIHGAHGYLIHEFHSPYSNHRSDEYGQDRSLFGKQVLQAVKPELPSGMPLDMRVSAIEYAEDGYGLDYLLKIADVYRQAGVDIFHVSSGGDADVAKGVIPTHAAYQVPYARAFKEAFPDIPVIAVGRLEDAQVAESVIANGDADLVAVGRGMLRSPYWPLEAGIDLRQEVVIPKAYERGFPHRRS